MNTIIEIPVKEDIKNTFNVNEAAYICDMMRDVILPPDINKTQLIMQLVYDADIHEGLGDKWDVNATSLMNKVSSLSDKQSQLLIDYSDTYWSCNVGIENNPETLEEVFHAFEEIIK